MGDDICLSELWCPIQNALMRKGSTYAFKWTAIINLVRCAVHCENPAVILNGTEASLVYIAMNS